jgi:signal transduction histidine kinase
MNNLLGNALKYTETGVITVAVERVPVPKGRDGCSVRISVKDTGVGIPSAKLESIFDPFVRAHEFVGGRDVSGAGLGLYIVKTFIHLMGGEIRALSEEGRGSEFILTLDFNLSERGEVDTRCR